VSESTTSDTRSTSLPEESTPASPNQPATAGTPSKSPGILATRKRRLRIAFIVLGALVIVFVIIPRIFHAWHTVSTDVQFDRKIDRRWHKTKTFKNSRTPIFTLYRVRENDNSEIGCLSEE
jgi:hypothetical protein